ncbi:class I SAM-dependent methyltransferase [Kribbella sp. NPDC003505]|uniref:class I SAM-dependent methyltransferase n=1 Tax=Kribbella sp. NPDC003505 TaxID=3154448 RepID=UPI00339F6FF3
MTELDPAIRSFYRDRYLENDRLVVPGHGRLEYLRTQELLRRWLPPAAAVLDVGGATGVHARWLAADGHQVTLVDPVEEHVEQAAAIGTFAAEVGDARALRQADASVDVTLLLGPLYHLVDAADRAQALAEAVRVTRPGGVVVAAAINRFGGLLEAGSNGTLTDENLPLFLDAFHSGSIDGSYGFTVAYFHHADALGAELIAAGLADVEVLGVEGPAANILQNAAPDIVDSLLPSAALLARQVESDPRLQAGSPHFLAHGRVAD